MGAKFKLAPSAAILCALLATGFGLSEDTAKSEQLIQVESTSLSEFPFLVFVHNERGFNCATCLGIKLSDVAILTTAKCLGYNYNVNGIRVGIDCSGPRDCSSINTVEEIVLEDSDEDHPERSPTRFAIVKLNAKINKHNANLMMGYYGHSKAIHYTVGFGRDSESDELEMAQFQVKHSGESLLIANNRRESVSNMGSPVLIRDENEYKLVGIVSFCDQKGTAVYRNLINEFGEISRLVEEMNN